MCIRDRIFCTTVRGELMVAPKNFGFSEQETQESLNRVCGLMDLEHLLDKHPMTLDSVSYTHLDVYKRQDTGSISNAAPARITSAKPAAIRRPGGCLLMKFIYWTLLSQNI